MSENLPARIRKRLLALALASGMPVREAAAQAGVCEKTAHRVLKNPRFVQRVRAIHAQMRERVVGQPATARVSAARALLEFAEKMSSIVTIEARVAALEAQKEELDEEYA